MMITADPQSFLGYVCREVDNLKVGEHITVCGHMMRREIPSFHHNGAVFGPADRVLENIVGSGYTHSYRVDPKSGDVTFERHEESNARRYQSPDRR
jgi:hypothetical protein